MKRFIVVDYSYSVREVECTPSTSFENCYIAAWTEPELPHPCRLLLMARELYETRAQAVFEARERIAEKERELRQELAKLEEKRALLEESLAEAPKVMDVPD